MGKAKKRQSRDAITVAELKDAHDALVEDLSKAAVAYFLAPPGASYLSREAPGVDRSTLRHRCESLATEIVGLKAVAGRLGFALGIS